MTNKEIANQFSLLASLMELHGENPFKIRSYQFAYRSIRAVSSAVAELEPAQLFELQGIGKAVGDKIIELRSTGQIQALEKYKDITPDGVIEMLGIKGIGPKKILLIWKELGIEHLGELLYAVNENRLIELKGFGPKIQAQLKEQLEYMLESKGKFHYAAMESAAFEIEEIMQDLFYKDKVALCGPIRRKSQEVEAIDILCSGDVTIDEIAEDLNEDGVFLEDDQLLYGQFKLNIHKSTAEHFDYELIKATADSAFFEALKFKEGEKDLKALLSQAKLPAIDFELMEAENISWVKDVVPDQLIKDEDIKGVIHSHTTYSDGAFSVEEMAMASKERGYEYLLITDHSKAAFYANGLSEERLAQQIEEINQVNTKLTDFKIFTGIEADILNKGDLDYDSATLDRLDVVIASVHSNLKMDEDKATNRILKAIEDPNTRILGHPSGRLILSRRGYPLDYNRIIDACAANGVVIEINANPYRLDIDWRWIHQCMEKGVMLSINPDAHSIVGIDDIHYGVCAARKGGLTKDACLNTKSVSEFETWVKLKR